MTGPAQRAPCRARTRALGIAPCVGPASVRHRADRPTISLWFDENWDGLVALWTARPGPVLPVVRRQDAW